ncbi:MAG: class I SAM-dependent RNA methyltransferase, partial [Lachnospiraceae bacterium]|nr:class I SAM-dependent RNA methyltransferase [Lachnospiraceae bacterium]
MVVKDVIPGQKVKVLVTKTRKDKAEGRLLEVIDKAAEETAVPKCPKFGICGGCNYQTLPYEEQLKLKMKQVKALLDPVCGDYEFEGIKGSPLQWEYRNKMEFSFGDEYKDGPLSLGMHKKGSFYDIVNADECQLVDEDYRKIIKCTVEHMAGRNIPYYHKMRHTGCLRHLLVRKAVKTGEILVDLVTSS